VTGFWPLQSIECHPCLYTYWSPITWIEILLLIWKSNRYIFTYYDANICKVLGKKPTIFMLCTRHCSSQWSLNGLVSRLLHILKIMVNPRELLFVCIYQYSIY
jgi:hypothetical protein